MFKLSICVLSTYKHFCVKKPRRDSEMNLSVVYDPYGNRTHVFAVRGRCLSRLTNGPYYCLIIISLLRGNVNSFFFFIFRFCFFFTRCIIYSAKISELWYVPPLPFFRQRGHIIMAMKCILFHYLLLDFFVYHMAGCKFRFDFVNRYSHFYH